MHPALTAGLVVVAVLASGGAARAGDDDLQTRADEVAALVAKEPQVPDGLFDAVFLREVPVERLRPILVDLHGRHGSVGGMRRLRSPAPLRGTFEASFKDGWVMEVDLGLAAEAPHRVLFLLFHAPAPGLRTLEDVAAEVARLPGKTSFGVYALGDGEPRALSESHGEDALAIGSAFKLYVLGALAREVAAGRRRWEDVLRLDPRWRSAGSGTAHAWPDGAPLTVHTLATLMISQSDNTAADHLLFTLGRETVESVLAPMGNGAAARDVPFLSTAEMFKLKWIDGGRPAREFLGKDAAGRRAYLGKDVAAMALSSMDTPLKPAPRFLDGVEWFASSRDLARAMDWLRRATESGPAVEVRSILAVNPGLPEAKEDFAWAGFKGGSESGVLDLTFLLRGKGGGWFAVTATWNDPLAPLDDGRLEGILRRALQVLGRDAAAPPRPPGK